MKLARMLFDFMRSKLLFNKKSSSKNSHNLLNISEQTIGDVDDVCDKREVLSDSIDPDLLLVEDDYLIEAFNQVSQDKKR